MGSNDPRSLLAIALAQEAKWHKVVIALREALSEGRAERFEPADRTGETLQGLDGFARMSGPEAARAVLAEAGKPLHIKEIIRRMAGQGYRVSNPKKLQGTLYTNLMRKKHVFRRTRPSTFGLVHKEQGQELMIIS